MCLYLISLGVVWGGRAVEPILNARHYFYQNDNEKQTIIGHL